MPSIRSVVACAAGSILLLSGLASQASAEIYEYTGNPFTTLTPPLALADSVHGTITLSNALAPNLVDFNALVLLTELEWSDGVRTFNFPGDTLAFSEINVSTDASANIIRWFVSFALEQGNAIGTCNDPNALYLECTIFEIFGSVSGSVGDLTQVPQGGVFPTSYVVDDPGTWTLVAAPAPVPTLSPLAVALLGTLLVAAGIRQFSIEGHARFR